MGRAETSRSFGVSATIQAGCAVDGLGTSGNAGTLGTLDFGTHPSVAIRTVQTSLTGSQAIRLRCTPGVALTMTADGGQHQESGSRHLQRAGNPADRLSYILCTDTGCGQTIGINQSLAVSVTSANMNDVRLPIAGQVTLPGSGTVGTFTDTVTVTLSW